MQKPPYAFAGFVSATILALYAVTLAPTTQFWDASEYIAAARILGIPHPPGNPLFVLVANVWGKILFVGDYAVRINLLSAFASASASGLLFLVTEQYLRPIVADRRARYLCAFAGILVGATSFTVWNQSNVNEKVYTLSLLSIALTLWLTLRWKERAPGPARNGLLICIVYILALSSTNHQMGLLAAPAILVLVGFEDWKNFINWRVWVGGAVVVTVASSVFYFLYVRAGFYPTINEGEPTTWEALKAVLNREQYQKPPLSERQADLMSQFANYLQYFSWQFAHDWSHSMRTVIAGLFGAIGIMGGVMLALRNRAAGFAHAALMFTVTLALVYYLNFKYGYSIQEGQDLAREVRERDYFFVASFQLFGVWLAVGFGWLVSGISGLFKESLGERRAWMVGLPVLLLALVPLMGNRLTASRAGETLARDFAVDLLNSLEPYAILVTAGDNDQFTTWYAQEVEGIRQDVQTANLSLMNTIWHVKQLKRGPVRPFDPDQSLGLYHAVDKPDLTLPSMSYEDIENLPPGFRIDQTSQLQLDSLVLTLRPGVYSRADLVVLRLIQDNFGNRPIYFAQTTVTYADNFGLTPFLETQGLARKLRATPAIPSDTMAFSQNVGWVNIPRTTHLMQNVYNPEAAALPRPRGWVDEPSASIIMLYSFLYAGVADLLNTDSVMGNADAARYFEDIASRSAQNIPYLIGIQPAE